MAKKIKFPLKMADGSQARNIEELREHFNLTVVLSYYASGRLIEWLTDRYYDDEAEKIKALEPYSKEFKKNLCGILAVPYSEAEADDVDLSEIAAKNGRYERLKRFTADDTILAAVDMVAFTQEDLADLLNKDAKLIYLCGERFSIPCSKGGVTYIGVNNPVVDVDKKFNKKGIVFKGVQGANILDDSIKSVAPSAPYSFKALSKPKDTIKADIAARNQRYERLKQFTADDTILAAVDMVAFTQEDLADLLNKDAKLIYLCGERFRIPCSKGGMTYIGVNNPVVDIPNYYDRKEITFKGVRGKNITDDSTKNVATSNPASFEEFLNVTGKKSAKISKEKDTERKDESIGTYYNSVFGKLSTNTSFFRLTVQTINEISGRGTVVEGVIEIGSVRTNDEVTITKKDGTSFQSVVLGIEMFRKILDYAEEGDEVGLLLRGISRKDVSKGDVVTASLWSSFYGLKNVEVFHEKKTEKDTI